MRGALRTTVTLAALTLLASAAACTSGAPSTTSSPPRPSSSPSSSSAIALPAPATSTVRSSTPRTSTTHPPRPTSSAPASFTHHVAPAPRKQALPLGYSTGNARQVVTVVAATHSSTTATLQAWRRTGHGWTRVGPAVPAWLGSDGIGPASEQSTATPQGSFALTQAFGREADPGTRLPYRRTTPADWWISQPGPLYNTEQHCASDCAFTQGDPNEHLYYEMPYYAYAVVIDYNRAPVRQGAGSAFFLHVTVGEPTQGCVSIERDQLVRIMRWLDPARHPRILMGVG